MKKSPIAIIGIGCRFPGDASSPGALWNMLVNRTDTMIDVPADRWDLRRFYDPDTDKPGKIHHKQGGFLKEKIHEFDPLFFGISPREARSLDPQQRILLEVLYEAIEDAGLQAEKLKGSDTGVFIGGFDLDNKLLQLGVLNRQLIYAQTAVNFTMTMLSNRLSYTFDLRGPSISIDTACSSSLVAVHTACQAIWNEDIELAVAGGVNVMILPDFTIALSKGRFTSKHGRSKAFDRDATGYGRGEGGGIVLLKPYEQALKDNDHIYALVKASAVNQDGQTPGITVPNPRAQKDLMQKVYREANIDINQIHYVEAHGTGTPVGDQVELEALNEVFSRNRKPGNLCRVGSIKTNIGHLEAAAGIAGFIKAALVLHHQQVPPNLHFNHPNPNVDFDGMSIKVVTQLEKLPENETSYVGINSFGYGGTNVHVLLQESPGKGKQEVEDIPRNPLFLFPISARDHGALKDLAQKYHDFIDHEKPRLADLIYSACFRRSHHKNRLAITADSIDQLTEKLESYTRDIYLKGVVENQANIREKPGIVFVYTGMGPQWWAMGRELMEHAPLFRQTLREYDRRFMKYAGWSVLKEMEADQEHSRMQETRVAQPANFLLQGALTELLKFYGIVPDAVVGHSVGEVTAAYISGALSLDDAIRVSFHRSRLQQKTAGQGKMLAVGMPETQARDLIKFYDDVSVASVNSPRSVTLSGNEETLKQLASLLEVKGIFQRMLKVEVPYHSYLMDRIKDELLDSLKDIKPQPTTLSLYSTVTGIQERGPGWDADYWWDNVRQPVRFGQAMETLINDEFNVFVEVGPHPVLRNSIIECLDAAGKEGKLIQTLNRKEPELPHFFNGLGNLYTLGFDIDWTRISPRGNFIKLPAYPWQKEVYWHESVLSRQDRLGLPGSVFLNNRVLSPEPAWDVELNSQFFPFINDHMVQNTLVVPGALYATAGLAISQEEIGKDNVIALENISFQQILVIETARVQMLRTAFDPGSNTYSVYSWYKEDEPGWMLHATGRAIKGPAAAPEVKIPLHDIKNRCTTAISSAELYKRLKSLKLEYGPYFRTIKQAWKGSGELVARLIAHESLTTGMNENEEQYILHPTILDGCFQAIAAFDRQEMIPVSMARLTCFHSPGMECWCYIKIKQSTANSIRADISIGDAEGRVAVEVEDLVCRPMVSRDIQARDRLNQWFYDFKWQETGSISPPEIPSEDPKHWLLFANKHEYSRELTLKLADSQVNCTWVSRGESYGKLAENHYQIHGDGIEDMQRLLTDTAGIEFTEILYIWAMEMEVPNETPGPGIFDQTVDQSMYLIGLVQALAKVKPDEEVRITIVTRDSQVVVPGDSGNTGLNAAPLWGLGYQTTIEFPFITTKIIDLESKEKWQSNPSPGEIQALANELLSGNTDDDAALRGNKRFVKSLEKAPLLSENNIQKTKLISTDTPVELAPAPAGKTGNLYYREFEHPTPGPDEIAIKVHAAAIASSDNERLKILADAPAKAVDDTYPGEDIGMEVSGVITRVGKGVTGYKVEDEVIALIPGGNFKSHVTAKANRTIHKPAALSHREAVILIPYLTVLYGLEEVAQLQKGEKILIHNATNGVGLAAVQYARWKGAEIFAAASGPEKQEYLKSIGVHHVMDSHPLEFSRAIKAVTNGSGVDVVIHGGGGETLYQSLSLLAPKGRLIETGQKKTAKSNYLPPRAFQRHITFAAIDVETLWVGREALLQKMLKKIQTGFQKGYFNAQPTMVFPAGNVSDALSSTAQEQHIGNIVLDFHQQEIAVEVKKEAVIKPETTYLITGGTQGFGLEIARWLSAAGAGHIVLISRSGAKSAETREAIANMEQQGAAVTVYAVDVTREDQVKELIDRITGTMPPLAGIFHLAMVLDDAFMMDLDKERLAKVMRPKIRGALNLHKYSSHLPMDHFICMSSIVSLTGNPGQAAYVAANAFLDAFSHLRAAQGLAGTAINLGVLADTGVVSRSSDVASILAGTGINAFNTTEVLEAMEIIMEKKPVQVGLFDIDWNPWMQTAPKGRTSSRFKKFTGGEHQGNEISAKQQEIMNQLAGMPLKEKQEWFQQILADELGKIVGLSPDRLDRNRGINFLGVDSVMVIEFIRAINKRLQLEITPVKLLKGPTISQLAASLLKEFEPLLEN